MTNGPALIRRRHLLGAGLLAPLAARANPAPLNVVVTFGAGGISDVVARLVAVPLSQELHQPIVVENRSGASGAIGARWVAQAAPDGQTLVLGTPSTQLVNPLIYRRPNYDPARDFTPVSLLARGPVVMVARPRPGLRNLDDWVRFARSRPGVLNYSSAGPGTTPHLGMELFKLQTATDIVHVPYRSGAEAAGALLNGGADLLIDAAAVLRQSIEAGTVQPLCAPHEQRCAVLPDVATATEQGWDAFSVPAAWFGLAAPTGTPAPRLMQLQQAVERVMARPEMQAQMLVRGLEPLPLGPHAYRATLERERPIYERVVKVAGVTVD